MIFEHLQEILRDHDSNVFKKIWEKMYCSPQNFWSGTVMLHLISNAFNKRFDSLSRKYGNPNYMLLLNFHCWCVASPVNFSKVS